MLKLNKKNFKNLILNYKFKLLQTYNCVGFNTLTKFENINYNFEKFINLINIEDIYYYNEKEILNLIFPIENIQLDNKFNGIGCINLIFNFNEFNKNIQNNIKFDFFIQKRVFFSQEQLNQFDLIELID